jgi:3',5'-cyclic AMP phosphodiesterase CpdA
MILRCNKYLILSLLILNISCTQNERKPFSFVQICDTQIGMGGYEHDIKTFKQAVKQINELNSDFVIICGDLVNHASDSSYSDFLKIKEELKIPCYVTPGNHDVGNVPNDSTLKFYRKTIGKDYYEFHNNGYSFFVVNTQLWKVKIENESEKHDSWFKETLKNQSNNKYPIIVMGHYPLYIKLPEEEEQYSNLPLTRRQELLKLFTQNNVRAYLSGHTHKRVINRYKNVQLVSGETTSKNFDKRPFGFRLWQVSADTVKHHFVSLKSSIIQQSDSANN